jgi:hypothetical protein
MFLAAWPNGDLHVLAQCRQKLHKASDGKVTGAVPHQQRDLRLLHAENFGDLDLCHAAVLKDCIDLQRELRFEQFLFGIGKAKVCEHVSAALGYMSHAFGCFFRFGFHLSFAFLCGPVQLPRAAA